ncbi:ubiquitin-like domain-containing protein [Streptomyces odontomachi]|uniref:ubiquitin-like domain-containing protein n=1 Tax=Streptomyces odontomachi TaxID=2944940 RepID=UPI00210A2584|nr:ubiquitin-like domain-containing protein [Streptomyces sp. ODS25]
MTTSSSERPIDTPIGPPDGERDAAVPDATEGPEGTGGLTGRPEGTAVRTGAGAPETGAPETGSRETGAPETGTAATGTGQEPEAHDRETSADEGRRHEDADDGRPHEEREDGCPDEEREDGARRRPLCAGRGVTGIRGARGALSAARAVCGAQGRAARRAGRDAARSGGHGGHGEARTVHGELHTGHGEARSGRSTSRGSRAGRAGVVRREPLRRLLPQALVVACLAGGTTAFVAHDKSVQLSIDGKPHILHTFADDVAELLDDEGVVVGTHDVVAPTPDAPLSDGDEVTVRHARALRITVDGRRRHVWTTAHTVDGALRVLGVRPEGAYVSVSRSRSIARTGLTLQVRTERTVHVRADGRTRTLHTNAASAAAAVRAAGIRLHGRDTLSMAAGSFPHDGQTIAVTRIRIGRKVRSETIPYPVRRTADPGLPRGTEIVARAGHPGVRRVTYATRTVDGVPQPLRWLASEVVRGPRPEHLRVGTKPPAPDGGGGARASGSGSGWSPARKETGPGVPGRVDGLDWAALARCESGGRARAVDPSGKYGGLYQFDIGTWRGLGGIGRPQDASPGEQTRLAKLLYARRGAAPWPVCGRHLTG